MLHVAEASGKIANPYREIARFWNCIPLQFLSLSKNLAHMNSDEADFENRSSLDENERVGGRQRNRSNPSPHKKLLWIGIAIVTLAFCFLFRASLEWLFPHRPSYSVKPAEEAVSRARYKEKLERLQVDRQKELEQQPGLFKSTLSPNSGLEIQNIVVEAKRRSALGLDRVTESIRREDDQTGFGKEVERLLQEREAQKSQAR